METKKDNLSAKNILSAGFKLWPIILLFVCFIALAVLATFLLSKKIDTSIYKERQSSLQNITTASAKTVDTEIKSQEIKAEDFSSVAEKMFNIETSLKNVVDFLNDAYKLDKDKFFFVDKDGKYFSSDGKNGRIQDYSYYTKSTGNDITYMGTLPHFSSTSTAQTSFIEDTVYIIFRHRLTTPMITKLDNSLSSPTIQIEYCSFMYDLGELNDIVSSLYGGKNNTFIYETRTGSMLYTQFDIGMLIDGYNIYSKFEVVDLVNGEKANNIINKCKNNEPIVVEMTINNKSFYACSAPLVHDEWSLFFVVQKEFVSDASSGGFKQVVGIVIGFSTALIIVFIILALFMFINRIRSEKIKNQEILLEKQEQLEEALLKAEKASNAKTTFLFNMSHDIRTPMNAIIGFTNIAKKSIDDKEKVINCLDKTQKSGEVLLSLINDMLEMSRIENGKVTLSQDNIDLKESFNSIIPMADELARAKNIDLSFEYDIKDQYVILDELRMQRLSMNMISNSIKYTPDGGYVKVKITQLDSSKEGYGKYLYTFEDNGIGMSEEFQKCLFQEYAREENSYTKEIQGTGLGLALCKTLVDLMGGEIKVKSKLNEGSTFSVTLEFKLIEMTKEDSTEEEVVDMSQIEGKRVLVVEDNALNREIIADILQEIGIKVDEAYDGKIAVDKLINNGIDAYDYILMDIQMPNMNGYEASREIRRIFPDKHIPIIALSANAFEEDKKKSLESGMDDHVAKPVSMAAIINIFAKFNK